MGLPKVVFYWCASCGGCEETVVDLDEHLLEVAAAVDIVFWPVALDFRYRDVEALEPGTIAVSFLNGAIRTSEQAEVARLLRSRSRLVIAFGACAISGGVPALANLTSREAIFDVSYHRSPTVVNPEGREPATRSRVDGREVELPGFDRTVRRLSDVVEVDYSVPGCPPTAEILSEAISALLEDRLPPRGAVLAPNRALCASCARNEGKPEVVSLREFRRIIDVVVEPGTCFLEEGVLCMGPATRDGCGQSCIEGNMPCSGCFGPPDGCLDQGAKMIAALGGILEGCDVASVDHALLGLPDPAGSLYRYGLSASLVGRERAEDSK